MTINNAETLGRNLYFDNAPDVVLLACAVALEEWNIHDLAALCRERTHEVPDFLRGLTEPIPYAQKES